jgi:hypothetical protein
MTRLKEQRSLATCSRRRFPFQLGHENVFRSGALQSCSLKGRSARKRAGHPDCAVVGQGNRRIAFETLGSGSLSRFRPLQSTCGILEDEEVAGFPAGQDLVANAKGATENSRHVQISPAIIRDSTTAVLLHPPESGRANQDARAIIGCNECVAVVRRGEAPATEVDVGSAGLRGDDGLGLRRRA